MKDGDRWKTRFFTIWAGQTLSLVGSALVSFALIWRLTEQTGSAAVLATASIAARLPAIALGPVVGALVDRWRRRYVLIVADGMIALMTALLAVLFWRNMVATWHIYLFVFAQAFGMAFHDPAMTASVSLMVPNKHLARIAGLDQTRGSATMISGPVLGAILVTMLPIQTILALDVAAALLAIGPLLFIDIPQPSTGPHNEGRKEGWKSVIQDTLAGLQYLWNWRGLFLLLVTVALIPLVNTPALALIPLLVKDYFSGGPMEWGLLTVARSVGTLVGGLLMSTWGGFRKRMLTMLYGLAILGIVNIARGVTPSNAYWLFLAIAAVSGVPAAMFFAALRALLQSAVPPQMQGRLFATQKSLFGVMAPIGLAIFGPIAEKFGIRTLFLLSGVLFFGVMIAWLLIPDVRNVDKGPDEQKPA